MSSNYQQLLHRLEIHSISLKPIQDNELLPELLKSQIQSGHLRDENCLILFRICQNSIISSDLSQITLILDLLLEYLDNCGENLQKFVLFEALSAFFITFSRTIQFITKPIDLKEVFKCLTRLRASETMKKGENLKSFENIYKLKMIPWLWESLKIEKPDFDHIFGIFQALSESQRLEINLNPAESSFINRVLLLIEKDLFNLKEKQMILGILTTFPEIHQDLKEIIQSLVEKFGICHLTSTSMQVFNKTVPVPEFVIPRLQLNSSIYSSRSDEDGLEVKVYKFISGDFSMAIKSYTQEVKTENFNRVFSEINVLKALTPKPNQNSFCFLEFYWEFFQGNSAYIAMEFHEKSLESLIQEKLENNLKFEDNELRNFIEKLLNSFQMMRTKGIFHRDIKPDNILVSRNGDLKIIDYNVAYCKGENDFEEQEEVRVIGSGFFMAPELRKAFLEGKKVIQGSNEKADVFSLGMTFLYLVVLDRKKLETLNYPENNQILKDLINCEVKDQYLKTLLNRMLNCDIKGRFNFMQCLSTVDQSLATIAN
jgi:hypothetical protein